MIDQTNHNKIFESNAFKNLIGLDLSAKRCKLGRNKLERHAIHAIALSRWFWSIVKNMSQMSTTITAMHLSTLHE
jgi:hypothetical protein